MPRKRVYGKARRATVPQKVFCFLSSERCEKAVACTQECWSSGWARKREGQPPEPDPRELFRNID